MLWKRLNTVVRHATGIAIWWAHLIFWTFLLDWGKWAQATHYAYLKQLLQWCRCACMNASSPPLLLHCQGVKALLQARIGQPNIEKSLKIVHWLCLQAIVDVLWACSYSSTCCRGSLFPGSDRTSLTRWSPNKGLKHTIDEYQLTQQKLQINLWHCPSKVVRGQVCLCCSLSFM